MEENSLEVFDTDQIERAIVVVRGKKVLLDEQLARFYGLETGHLVRQVKRNASRFPNDFMFQVTNEEWVSLKSQFVISKRKSRGGRRTPPYAFTETCKQIQKFFGLLHQLYNHPNTTHATFQAQIKNWIPIFQSKVEYAIYAMEWTTFFEFG